MGGAADSMPRYYCDYCDTFLTHDSPAVRKQHNAGYKHKANVRNYYMQFDAEDAIGVSSGPEPMRPLEDRAPVPTFLSAPRQPYPAGPPRPMGGGPMPMGGGMPPPGMMPRPGMGPAQPGMGPPHPGGMPPPGMMMGGPPRPGMGMGGPPRPGMGMGGPPMGMQNGMRPPGPGMPMQGMPPPHMMHQGMRPPQHA